MAEAEKLFKINIVTPNGLIYSHRGSSVSMRAIDGDRQILYNHLPILTPLTIGEVRVQRGADVDHKVDHIAVSGGIIEFANNVATIIADNAERARNIDLSRAEAAKK
ncbi:ATP synthase F1 subunit epsilon, partial [Lactobacillus delbrueckii subsp. bulgaricus]|nr:ATP synthase F1 subunit epsilon [Lactobacillus delbrueckii subsp. bulgaricus]